LGGHLAILLDGLKQGVDAHLQAGPLAGKQTFAGQPSHLRIRKKSELDQSNDTAFFAHRTISVLKGAEARR
jgi:hypothetical protein